MGNNLLLDEIRNDIRRQPLLLTLLRDIKGGADIYDRTAAAFLRKCCEAGLVEIVEAMDDIPGHMRQPYFGAILLAPGETFLRERWTKQAAGGWAPAARRAKGATGG